MKQSILLVLLSALLSCSGQEEELKEYYIQFELRANNGLRDKVTIKQESPLTLSGNDTRDSDFIWVDFDVRAMFEKPGTKNVGQFWSFFFAQEIPKEEFSLNLGKHEFKNPENFAKYVPTGNMYKNPQLLVNSYFYEGLPYCTSSPDPAFNHSFRITRSTYFVDEEGNAAMNLEGTFSMRYLSVCTEEVTEITKGTFRLKLLIDPIP